jgi:hypothetical protein
MTDIWVAKDQGDWNGEVCLELMALGFCWVGYKKKDG